MIFSITSSRCFHLELIILAAKDVRLAEIESKMTRLEESDIQQELLIKELRKEREFSSSNSEQSVGKSDMIFRTCGELTPLIRLWHPECTAGSTPTAKE